MFRRLISTSATWIPLPLRLAMSVIFVAHGAQKVLGSFNGPGLEKWVSIPAPFSFMKPGWLWLGAAAFSELIGGILLFLGLLTRLGAFLIACTMITALISVHWPGFFMPKGIEYPLALFAICLALLISGGGMASVDLAMSSGRRR
ncbi:MAG TPA: DoxX family protein [Pyrinomonadaceae bacterium]|jgi:putative oxidoreductase|nr:DoxX family protein [Pyrinomonadaceae bacterium]